ncbi:DNA polymerase III subunit chi [Marivivens marinus]|uniref:DNA polymerase III subunit chi n=1 Tax=Marivivens marinus TaxID=3110173 RepID=UPI003B845C00
MGAAFFYHLTESPLEAALPLLLGKARERGWRIELRGTDRARLDRLDQILWERPEDGFLPHGMAGGPHDADQPILFTLGQGAANSPACVMAVDGAEVSAEEAQALERLCVIFDGANPDAVAHARTQWKALTDAGCAAQYWAQDGGRWVKKAEKGDS